VRNVNILKTTILFYLYLLRVVIKKYTLHKIMHNYFRFKINNKRYK